MSRSWSTLVVVLAVVFLWAPPTAYGSSHDGLVQVDRSVSSWILTRSGSLTKIDVSLAKYSSPLTEAHSFDGFVRTSSCRETNQGSGLVCQGKRFWRNLRILRYQADASEGSAVAIFMLEGQKARVRWRSGSGQLVDLYRKERHCSDGRVGLEAGIYRPSLAHGRLLNFTLDPVSSKWNLATVEAGISYERCEVV